MSTSVPSSSTSIPIAASSSSSLSTSNKKDDDANQQQQHPKLVVTSPSPASSGEFHNHHQHQHHKSPPIRSISQLFSLFAVSFSYALMFATMSNIVIAKEVDRLESTSQTTWVGVIMAVGALAQIITPVVGAWSDRSGAREPFLKAGTVLVLFGIGVLTVAGTLSSMIVLFVSQLVISAGLSIQYAMITVTLHDHVSEEQIGVGSSAMASLGILGAGVGYSLFAIGLDLNVIFGVYAFTTIACFGFTISSMNGISLASAVARGNISSTTTQQQQHNAAINLDDNNNHSNNSNEVHNNNNDDEELFDGGESTHFNNNSNSNSNNNNANGKCGTPGAVIGMSKVCEILVHALTVPSPFAFPDFSLALCSRALFNAGLACQGYMVFFFRDVVKIGTLPPEQVVSRLAVLALLGGLIGAVPAGYLSDRWGKKPVIFIASLVCISAIISFPFLSTTTHFDLIGLLFGVGNTCFLSIDYALGVQSLPRKLSSDGVTRRPIDAAKDLGVFALSATVGMLLGQLVFAGILEKYSTIEPVGKNGAPESRYAPSGFMLTFGIASIFFALSAVCAGMIKQLK